MLSLSRGASLKLMANKTLPAATVQSGFVGTWTPPAEYGTLVSPAINITADDWQGIPPGMQGAPRALQFATNLGQQIGNLFIFYGTYIGPPNAKPGSLGCGYLSNPKTFAQSGSPAVFQESVMIPGIAGWAAIEGQPWLVLNPPATVGGKTATQILQNMQNEINELHSLFGV